MKLNKLVLTNFQGIKSQEFDFNGDSATIYGDNATGKTTVFNSITWLLFDKASTGAKGYNPKTNDEVGLHKHNLEHSAEAIFTLETGQIIKFKKVFKEVYKKTRGSNIEEFSGHTTDYYIDDVPTGTEREYINTILKFCNNDIEILKKITMPDYFPSEIGWADRRQDLLDICGDITDDEVINSNKDLSELKIVLLKNGTVDQYHSVDEYKKIATAKKSEINKNLESIPSRIDEVQRSMPNVEGVNFNETALEIEYLTKQKHEVETQKAESLSSNDNANTVKVNIANLKADMAQTRESYITSQGKLNGEKYNQLSKLGNDKNIITIEISKIETNINISTEELKKLNDARNSLLQDYQATSQLIWDTNKETCPTCRQTLQLEEIERLKTEFNLTKSNKLEQINAKGKKEASKEMIGEVEVKIQNWKDKLEQLKTELENINENETNIRNSIVLEVAFEETNSYKKIKDQIESQEKILNGEHSKSSELTKVFDDKILEYSNNIKELETILLNKELVQKGTARISELENQEKELAREFEIFEKNIFLCELFIKTKVSMLTDKINSKFENVRFRLFVDQQNGGVKEDCEVMVRNGKGILVPYTNANNAGKINAGLEIIDVLSKHYGVSMPIFVDNAESVTKLKEMGSQVIRLVVSEEDKVLRLGA